MLGVPEILSFEKALTALNDHQKQVMAKHWSEMALSEHASIGSFSSFSLQLLSLAAPPKFLDMAHQAARDEIRHAQMCFAIASDYAGEMLSPGPLPLKGDLLGELTPESILFATIQEGCIGETLSAAELELAFKAAKVPRIQSTLRTIIEEESVHAQLAWGVVQWLLNEKPNLKTTAQAAFEPVLTGQTNPCPPLQAQNEPLHAHGYLDSHHRWHAHRKACREIIRPAALALLR